MGIWETSVPGGAGANSPRGEHAWHAQGKRARRAVSQEMDEIPAGPGALHL